MISPYFSGSVRKTRKGMGKNTDTNIRLIISVAVLCILLAFASFALADQPLVTITPVEDSVEIDDEIEFEYSILRFDDFELAEIGIGIFYTGYMEDPVYADFDEESFCELYNDTGSFLVPAEFGYGICVQIRLHDEAGKVYTSYSDIVTVDGYEPEAPQVLITPRTMSADIGDTVCFDYEVLDVFKFKSLKARIGIYTDPELRNYEESGSEFIDLEKTVNGKVEYKATTGYGIAANFQLTDMDGRTWSFLSETVAINHKDVPQITVSTETTPARLGDTVTFTYTVTNAGGYRDPYALVDVFLTETLDEYEARKVKLSALKGSFTHQVEKGYGIRAEVYVTDQDGNSFYAGSETVPVNNLTLFLPEDLERIEDSAFAGDKAFDAVRIPAGVVYIAENAFGDRTGLIIYGEPGTEAEAFANSHEGYTFIAEVSPGR